MKHEFTCIINAIIFSVLLNIGIPQLISYLPLDKSNEIFKMLDHHKITPVSSSIIVAVITGLSVYLGYLFKPLEKIKSLI